MVSTKKGCAVARPFCFSALRRPFFHIHFPLAERGEAVHPRPMSESLLGGADVFGLAFPCGLGCVLERSPVGECQLPGQVADLVHRVEMRGRLRVALAA